MQRQLFRLRAHNKSGVFEYVAYDLEAAYNLFDSLKTRFLRVEMFCGDTDGYEDQLVTAYDNR